LCSVSSRSAIEEELEVLYDAYYEELERYANIQQRYASSGGAITPPPGPGPFPGSVELDKNGMVVGPGGKALAHPHPTGRQKVLTNGPKKPVPESEFDEDDPDGDDYEEEEYDEEDEEEEEDEEDDVDVEDDVDIRNRAGHRTAPAQERARTNGKLNHRDDLFSLGQSLTVTGKGLLYRD
jgi:hypothetical protein